VGCIKSRSFNPGRLTYDQLTVILDFASSLPPGKSQIEFVKTNHRADSVREVSRELRILVKDTAKKLRTAIEHDYAERVGDEVAGPPSK